MKTPEGYEKDDICEYLDSLTGLWYFRPFMAGYGKSGISDIISCYRGEFWSVEVKREGKEPTALQSRRIAEIEKVGGKATWGTAARVIPILRQWKAERDAVLARR